MTANLGISVLVTQQSDQHTICPTSHETELNERFCLQGIDLMLLPLISFSAISSYSENFRNCLPDSFSNVTRCVDCVPHPLLHHLTRIGADTPIDMPTSPLDLSNSIGCQKQQSYSRSQTSGRAYEFNLFQIKRSKQHLCLHFNTKNIVVATSG